MNMSRRSDSSTIQYYDQNAAAYVDATVGILMQHLYRPFLTLLPPGGKILDAGCGSGRDSRLLSESGFDVTAIDGSAEMVAAAKQLTELPVQHLMFQQLAIEEQFDGVWACASLLHVPLNELDDVLSRLVASLRPGGILYVSFKEGDGERVEAGRHFTDLSENALRAKLEAQSSLETLRIWMTEDHRPDQSRRWVNGLARKRIG
jgi:2-polyprenyl-3-methyl-5-hydroxy-6-metoxy-1,4-benzoquinol methylase